MNDKELTLFCPVWGQKHLDLLQNYALPSLMLPKNLPSLGLEKIYVECIGVNHEKDHTFRVVSEGLKGLPIEMFQHGRDRAEDPVWGLRAIIRKCIDRGTRMLLAMPDTLYSNGSISNIFNYAKGKNVTVAAAHVRVNEDLFMGKFPRWHEWPNSQAMARAAFSIGAFDICDTHKDNVASVGGVAWTQVNETTKLVLHYLPTSYLAWFTEDDFNWWNSAGGWSGWDHSWPPILLQQRRFRVVGSSDVFFAMELEDAARSGSLRPIPGSQGNELYNGRQPHHDICGCFLIDFTL